MTHATRQEIDALRARAEAGVPSAQFSLGFRYNTGQGVPQDYVEAVRWYRLAADQGYATAQANLGVMYADGQGVPQDYVEAVRWYRLAADQGHARAQGNLGVMYGTGEGVPQDYVQAHMWFNLAASRMASGHRQHAVDGRDRAAGQMNPTQIAEAGRLAREWTAAHPRES